MKTQELFSVMQKHQDKPLLFEYEPNAFVGANYHITEVKHVKIDSVDCGSGTDAWNETVIQLWESPKEIDKRDFMFTNKALSILNKVGSMKPYDLEAEIKFEYSNNSFNTAQLFVNDFEIQNGNLIFKLAVEKTDCKAKETCGTSTQLSDHVSEEKEAVLASKEECCSPVGNCC